MIGITGITGHIGYTLASRLTEEGIAFRALVRNTENPWLKSLSGEIISGDILDQTSLNSFCQGIDTLIHLAGYVSIHKKDSANYQKINVEAVQNIIHACLKNKVDTLIHFSSIHAHKSEGAFREINEKTTYAQNNQNFYDYSKAQGEQLVLEARNLGLNTVILNPTGVIGPFDIKPSLTGRLIIKLYEGKLPVLVNGGFNWVDVRDVVEAVISILKRGVKNDKFILSGTYQSLQSIASLIYAAKDKKYKGVFISISLAKAGIPFAEAYNRITRKPILFSSASLTALEESSRNVNGEKAIQTLGLHKTPFERTIFDTLQWFRENHFIQ